MKHTILFLLVCFITLISSGQWVNNNTINNEVASTAFAEQNPFSISDGAGGTIVFFRTTTSVNNEYDLGAQKITAAGVIGWGSATTPVFICNAVTEQYDYKAIPDGNGGAFVTWSDNRENSTFGKVYVQHIDASGTSLWTANGIKVADLLFRDDYLPALCSDGNGGIIVTWTGDNYLSNVQMYAQRFSSAGLAQWTTDGVTVCSAPGFRGGPVIVSDNNNGAMLFFTDTRNDPNGLNYDSLLAHDLVNADIYAQRLDGTGAPLWTINGVAVCTMPGNQDVFDNTYGVSDGSGGAVLVFGDGRNDLLNNNTNTDLFAQRVNSSGNLLWSAGGVPVCTSPGNQRGVNNFVVADGSGGIVLAWNNTDSSSVFAQKISGSGLPAWAINGVPVSPSGFGNRASDAVIVSNSPGSYIIAFEVGYGSFNSAVLAQKLDDAGVKQWATGGVQVADISEGRTAGGGGEPQIVLSDSGAVIVSWEVRGTGLFGTQNIYASKLLSPGNLAGGPAGFITVADGNWNNANIWMGGQVPYPGIAAIVRHHVNVTSNALCYSLKVEQPNGSVTVKAGVSLYIEH